MRKPKRSAARCREWLSRRGSILGVNYVPAYAVNPVEMWQEQTFDLAAIAEELRIAADWGYNALRVFLPFCVWKEQRQVFRANLAAFLDCAQELGFCAAPVLLDDCRGNIDRVACGEQPEPLPGVHNGRWTDCPGNGEEGGPEGRRLLREYVTDVISSFSRHPAVLFWDLYNEPGNGGKGARSLPLLRGVFRWARSLHPPQPLTAGCWAEGFLPRSSPVHRLDRVSARLSDIVTFHCYADPAKTLRVLERWQAYKRPVLCTEWMARTLGSTISEVLPLLLERCAGGFQWGLVSGRTQTRLAWGENPDGEPATWFHDVLRPGGEAYSPEEKRCVRALAGRAAETQRADRAG